MSHADLIARLEKAPGPHPYLDEAIWEAIGGWPERKWRSVDYMKAFGTPVTGSLDAAMMLAGDALPKWSKSHGSITWTFDKDERRVWIVNLRYYRTVATHQFAPIALLIATLKALQEKHNER